MKWQQVAASTTASVAEEGALMDGLRSRVDRWPNKYTILFL